MTGIARKAALAAVLALPALAAACGGGSSSAPVAPSQTVAAAANGGTVDTASALGPILVAQNGMTLYMFARDHGGKSACSGGCAKFWPPYTGTPKVGAGLTASLLGSTMRADGSSQVAYDGHPLYTYSGDPAPGDTNGQGVNTFGALWWVVAPDGKVVKTSAQASGGQSGYGH